MKCSPNSELLAILETETGLATYHLNRSTGELELFFNDTTLMIRDARGTKTVAFSPDNSKLYAAFSKSFTNMTRIYQYDLAASSAADIIASRQVVWQDTTLLGIADMQLAVDGKLYFTAIPSRSTPSNPDFQTHYLSVIDCPNAAGPACGVQLNALYLAGQDGGYLLPTQDQTLFVNANHVQASANPPVLCAGDSARLTAYGGGATTVRWFPATGLSSATIRNPTAAPTQTTTYTVIAQRECGPPDTARVRVVVTAGAGVVEAGRDTTVCAGAVVRLGGPAPDPAAAYLWGPARYLSGTRAPRPLLSVPRVPRDTVLAYVVRAYCTARPPDTVRITVRALPALAPMPLLTVCPGDTLRLGAPAVPGAPAVTYQWAPAALLSAPTAAQPTFAVSGRPPLADTTYVFARTVRRPGAPCAATDSVRVRVRTAAAIPDLLSISVDTLDEARIVATYAVARPADFLANSLSFEAQPRGQRFALLAPVVLPAAGSAATFAAPAVPGAAYRLAGAGYCNRVVSSAHVPVTLRAELLDSLGTAALWWSAYRGWGTPPGALTYTVLVQRDPTGAYAALASSSDTTFIAPAAPARYLGYRIRATAPDGRRSESNSVVLNPQPGLLAYNIISPDGDGRNDAFVVENLAYYPGTALTVYSRWGQLVYEAADYRSGAWRAEGLSAGVYFYRLVPPGGPAMRGWVEVVR